VGEMQYTLIKNYKGKITQHNMEKSNVVNVDNCCGNQLKTISITSINILFSILYHCMSKEMW